MKEIQIPYRSTPKNIAVLKFLERLGEMPYVSSEGERVFCFSINTLINHPNLVQTGFGYRFLVDTPETLTDTSAPPPTTPDFQKRQERNLLFKKIATTYHSASSILEAIRSQRTTKTKSGFVPPNTMIEKELAILWADLLGLKEVGICDNFFDLGGHSVLATQLLSRIRKVFDVEFPLNAVFTELSSIQAQAEAIENVIIDQASQEEMDSVLQEMKGMSEEEMDAL